MGSLRDQLLAKGVVSKKDQQRVDREQKQARKQAQGHRERQSRAERHAAEVAEAERAAREEALIAERRTMREAEDVARAALRVNKLVLSNRLRDRGKQTFFHRALDGRTVIRRKVSERIAFMLRSGQVAVAGLRGGPGKPDRYYVITAAAARELLEVQADVLVHFVTDTHGLADPAEAFWEPEEEISLRAHRVSEAAAEAWLRGSANGVVRAPARPASRR